MAEKRKAYNDSKPSKKAKLRDETQQSSTKRHDPPTNAIKPSAKKSVLSHEEKAFPRGGASVLTPLEQKQIHAQAERDALLEEATGKKAPQAQDDDGDLFDEPGTKLASRGKAKKSQMSAGPTKEHTLKIHSLGYKSLVPGSLVLGRVTAITSSDIALALPNNLTGFASITAISASLNERIEALLASEEEDEDDEAEAKSEKEEKQDDVVLSELFKIGQWLRAAVMEPPTASEQKRHIQLSLDPSLVNNNLSLDNVAVNTFLQASVRSIEDHGVVMDVGLLGTSVRGFIGKKELGHALSMEKLSVGQVMLCLVTGKAGNGQTLKLTPDTARFAAVGPSKHSSFLSDLPDVDVLVPGVAIDALITATSTNGVTAKAMGMVDVSADVVHSDIAGLTEDSTSKKYAVGSKIRARVIWSLPKDDGSRFIGISFLAPLLTLPPSPEELDRGAVDKVRATSKSLQQTVATSTILEDAEVVAVSSDRGLYLNFNADGESFRAFCHISQISDDRIVDLLANSGKYKIGSKHNIRVLNFNPVDALYYVCMKASVLAEPFLRLEDLTIGEKVTGKVERLILSKEQEGVSGIIIRLSKSITALVPASHMSDTVLKHPEKKWKPGTDVQGRILDIDLDKRQVRVTLKKMLVTASQSQIWTDYSKLEVGDMGRGTVIKLLDKGAVLQFFGNIRGFLPISEISEAFVESVARHFKPGQTVGTRVLSINAETAELKVSCRDREDMDEQSLATFDKLALGQLVSATISAILGDKIELELEGGIKGVVNIGHLVDGSAKKAESRLQKLRVGQRLNDLVIISKAGPSVPVFLTYKSSMVSAAQDGTLVTQFDQIKSGMRVNGYVQNITPHTVYVNLTGHLTGALPSRQLLPDMTQLKEFGLRRDQSITAWVDRVDEADQRFSLSMREPAANDLQPTARTVEKLTNSADPSLTTTAEITLKKVTKAYVASCKSTQINVRLADGIHGRIDVSEVFDSWSEIKNSKSPLQGLYKTNEDINVTVLGTRDAKGWRYLPFSHQSRGHALVELSAKQSRIDGDTTLLTGMSELRMGKTYVAFVNSVKADCVWVSLSPAVRGRIALLDLSNDLNVLQSTDLRTHFPLGCALQVKVKSMSSEAGKLDLINIEVKPDSRPEISLQTLNAGDVVLGQVTKVAEYGIIIQLASDLAGVIPLTELSDDFDQAQDLQIVSKHQVLRARVLSVDKPNKRIVLSSRPSLVLSSSLPVKDAHLSSISAVKQGALVRGMVKHIGEKRVLVSLSGTVDAFVPISDLSDDYIKDWQSHLELHQVVKARVIAVDPASKSIQLSLKKSHIDADYKPPLKLDQIDAGMIVTGVARKVEDFGVFIDIDNTRPRLSGLAHRSEIAETRVSDVRDLYKQGDRVKAKVLKVDVEARKISLGLKASYFVDEDAMSVDEDSNDEMAISGHDVNDVVEEDIELQDASESGEDDFEDAPEEPLQAAVNGLSTSGFDWTGDALNGSAAAGYESEPDQAPKKKRSARSEIKADLTGDLDKHGPRTTSDFERQLLGQPNDSGLWIQYMAFHLQLSEIQQAREIAERALRNIHIREVDEKANIWVALINLEVEYGDDDSVEAVFKRACQLQDSLLMHEKLASIYIDSGKHDKADAQFERIIGNKAFRASPDIWLNYATFLMTQLQQPDKGRALLARALQSIHQNEHRLLTAKFAALEFRTSTGDAERGRTIFEALVSEWPRWTAGWDMWVDTERSKLSKLTGGSDGDAAGLVEQVRRLYERMTQSGMKKRRANFVFKRWLEFEELHGDSKHQDIVKDQARAYVEQLKAKSGDQEDD